MPDGIAKAPFFLRGDATRSPFVRAPPLYRAGPSPRWSVSAGYGTSVAGAGGTKSARRRQEERGGAPAGVRGTTWEQVLTRDLRRYGTSVQDNERNGAARTWHASQWLK